MGIGEITDMAPSMELYPEWSRMCAGKVNEKKSQREDEAYSPA